MSDNASKRLDELRRALALPNRVRDLEEWRRLAMDLIDHCGDDIIKLEERIDVQDERVMRLELAMGIAIVSRDVEG